MANILKISVFIVAFVLFVHVSQSAVTFTGEVSRDFANVSFPLNQTTIQLPSFTNITCSLYMSANNLISGWDLKSLAMQYDWNTDTLYVGWDCWVICGDADGDGDPSGSKDRTFPTDPVKNPSFVDYHLQELQEATLQTFWTAPPSNYSAMRNRSNPYQYYVPDFVVGDNVDNSLVDFNSYLLDIYQPCDDRRPRLARGSGACLELGASTASAPGNVFGAQIPLESAFGRYRSGIQNVQLARYPNATWPDIEFTIRTFSRYGNFSFTPGTQGFKFATALFLGSGADSCGEEFFTPVLIEMPCTVRDFCGICGGNNLTCLDCNGVPNGPARPDACNVCGGNNQTCWDCAHIPNGNNRYDHCGVCGGTNSTCLDCAGVANGPQRYDSCGVCGGTNSTCLDCAGIANGPNRYDACGVCNGNNQTCWDCAHIPNGNSRYDHCGVCGGTNSTCLDCAGVANGNSRYDHCGVCGGTNSTCLDCAGVANGPKRYDACGVCNGNNRTCWDCARIPNGPSRYDACGVCGGTNSTCLDCAGVANGNSRYDHCGVCGGTNSTCLDCAGVANGPKRYDACGVCNGNNRTCWDCAHIPNGNSRYDHCGVCGGTNSTCLDCAGVANGNSRYDHCGVCGGTNSTCLDCAHVANGPSRYDSCGVCGGNNSTCLDCFGVANGGAIYDLCGICGGNSTTCVDCTGTVPTGVAKVYDACGVCDGDNSSCWDCAHIPNGPWVYDLCGVCGGHNEDCDCWIYKNISLIAEDTYISLEKRNDNYDKSMDLVVSSNKERTLLKFDDVRFSILGATEQKPEILSAKIRLYIRGVVKLPQQGFEDNKVVLHNLDNNFCAEKATWECRDVDDTGCCVEWKMLALYPKIKADYAWEETQSIEIHNFQQGWVEFDVQEDIEDFLQHSFANSKSYLIKKGCEKDYGWIRFWSSESGGQFNAPELSVSIKARCGPQRPPSPPADPCDTN